MIFVLDTAIGFGVWLPFTLGKTTALLSVRHHELYLVLPNAFIF
jgi:E3 ubiquitin-protein ligase MARCH6